MYDYFVHMYLILLCTATDSLLRGVRVMMALFYPQNNEVAEHMCEKNRDALVATKPEN